VTEPAPRGPEPDDPAEEPTTYHGSTRRRELAGAAAWAMRSGTRQHGRRRPGGDTRPPGRI
jgi:hypothetical protein